VVLRLADLALFIYARRHEVEDAAARLARREARVGHREATWDLMPADHQAQA
jgi:hypothetical protein